MATVLLVLMLGWVVYSYGRNGHGAVLLRSRKPFLPTDDRPPLPGRIAFTSIEDYVASGYTGIQVHLMQAARRSASS